MSRRVLFSGYYGLGNAGDEAVLTASVGMFRERRPELGLAALSADPPGTRALAGIDAAPRMKPGAVLDQLRRCALFLSGGGSLLQDRTSLKSLLYYLLLLDLARRAGARTMVFAQGIGPLVRPAARRLTARVLSRVDGITVRDPDSATLLREIGVKERTGREIEVTADPVFALAPRATPRVEALSKGPPALAVSLRPWAGEEAIQDALAAALEPLAEEAPLQAWALYPGDDSEPARRLAARLPGTTVVDDALAPAEWMALAGRARLVIGMRLHALIFAAARAVPVLGISYDPKVDALLARLGTVPVARTGEAADSTVLRAAVRAALEAAPARREEREALAASLRADAYRNVERALQLLD